MRYITTGARSVAASAPAGPSTAGPSIAGPSIAAQSSAGTPARGEALSRRRLVAAGLTAGIALTAGVLAWHPGPPRDDVAYASYAEVRDAAWVGGLLDHIGWALVVLGLPLGVCFLVRERGARLATIGSVLVAVGGMFFVSTFYAYNQLAWHATEPDALSPEAGTALMSWISDHPARLMGPEAVSFFAFDIGVLLLCAALWRSRTTPRWVPIGVAVFVVGQFLVPTSLLDVVQILLLVSMLPVAWFVGRIGVGAAA